MRYQHAFLAAFILTTTAIGACASKKSSKPGPTIAEPTKTVTDSSTSVPPPNTAPSTNTSVLTSTDSSTSGGPSLGALASAQTALPNFHQVNAKIFRSGRPDELGFKAAQGLGVKTVLTLEDNSSQINKETAWAKSLGMKLVSVPMGALLTPKVDEILKAVSYMMDANSLPILVHCKEGSDRTGIVVGAYHIKADGWTAKQAIDDMRLDQYGHSRFLYFWDNVLESIK